MIVSEMHFNALRSLTQPYMTAYWLCHNTYDPGTSPGSANQYILEDVYLRSNLPRKRHAVLFWPAVGCRPTWKSFQDGRHEKYNC